MTSPSLPKPGLDFVSLSALLLCFFAIVSAPKSFSQTRVSTGVVKGYVRNADGEFLVGATVGIRKPGKYTLTDSKGAFTLDAVPSGSHELSVSFIGYKELGRLIVVESGATVELQATLEDKMSELSEVVITGKTEAQLVREQPIRAEVIDTRALSTQPATMQDLMNRSAGVRVRQTGGLGSTANIMLNGFQDRAIKYFKDGIPMDYLGAGYNFALVPVNMLERMEIYKGVLPTSLGADALGGGINMVSKESLVKYLEASYEVASFNTHRGSLNAYYQDSSRNFFVGGDAFINHSDNDYEVTVAITDPDLGTQSNDKVKLFHNNFSHYYGEIYGGFHGTRWADDLRISLTGFWMDRDNQYGSRMSQPFGASTNRQYSLIPTIRYRKVFNRISLDQFLVANTIHVNQVDTAKGIYNWYGEFFPSGSRRGEMTTRGSLAKTDFSYLTSRTNIGYYISPVHRLELNVVYSALERKGSDPLGLTFVGSGRDVLSVPAHYDKLVSALGLESKLFDERLTNNLIAKYYYYETRAVDGDYYGNEVDRTVSNQRYGVADAIKYAVNDISFVRLSAEIATRLPEQDELFGDGNLHVSNLELKPEKSTNINVGYRISKSDKYALEFNSFYRITHDLILNVPYNFLFNQHQNVDQVKGIGFETDATLSIFYWLKANGNFTYQDFRLFDTNNSTTEGARLRNTPYFFANLGLNAAKRHLLNEKDNLQAYWYFSFVREYYLDYIPKDREPDGFLGLWGQAGFDAPNIIPNQSIHSLGVTYFPFNKLAIGVQVKNLFDANVYDNFKIQNAGRSYHAKLTYTIR